ncbi:MAG TPA: class I SAM-dependent methyltransferase [Acidothermaceae bacterium]|nr:class I SAM-dependent methyltransferase [Acidothermaceae bacterium]
MADPDLDREAAAWDELGRRDPHWAILSEPGRQGSWDEEGFFATGRAEIDITLKELGELLTARNAALDFGCGLGRLSQALAVHFESVTGVDVAASMIEGAQARNAFPDRVSYVVNTTPTLPFDDATFDFAYSILVLQHIPPKVAAGYISELVRVLRPGGVVVFQELSHRAPTVRNAVLRVVPNGVLKLLRRARRGWAAPMTMDGVPRRQVTALVAAAGGEVVDVRDDASGEPVWKGYRYTVRRPPAR